MDDRAEATLAPPPDGQKEPSARPPSRRRGCGLFLFLLGGIGVLLLAGLAVAWWQGALPRRLTLEALQRVLTAHVELGDVAIDKTVRIASLRLSQPEHLNTAPPTVYLEGLKVAYTPFPADGRYIEHVDMDLLQVQADMDLDPPTIQWYFDWGERSTGDSGEGSLALMPKTLHIKTFDGGYKANNFLLAVRDLEVSAAFPASGQQLIDFSANELQLIEEVMRLYDSRAPENGKRPATTHTGVGSGRMLMDKDTIEINGAIEIPETLNVKGSSLVTTLPDGIRGRVVFDHFHLANPVWSAVVSTWLPTPLDFEALSLSAFSASGGIYTSAFEIDEATLRGEATAFRLGPEDTPYLRGDLQASGEGSSVSGRAAFQARAALNDAPEFLIDFAGVPTEWELGLRTPAWSRDGALQHFPILTPLLNLLPGLSSMEGDFKLLHREQRNDFSLQASGTAATEDVRLEGVGTLGGEALAAGRATLSYREGQASGPFTYHAANHFGAQLQLNALNPALWLAGLLGNEALNGLDAPASGELNIEATGDAIAFDLQAALAALRYNGATYHEGDNARLEAKGEYKLPEAQASGSRLHLGLGETASLTLGNWRAESTPARLQGSATVAADLAAVGKLFDQASIWGDLQATGPLRFDEAGVHFEARLQSEGFGYGDWATPYHAPIDARTTIEVSRDGAVRMHPLELQLGDAMRLTATQLDLAQDETGAILHLADLSLDGSLRTFVSLGLFAAAEGQSTIESTTLQYGQGDWQGDVSVSLEATELMLPGEVAKLNDTMLSGAFTYDKGLAGAGRLNIGLLNAGGAELSDFGSDVRAEDSHLHFENIATDLFYGRIEGRGQVEVFDPRFHFRLELNADSLDLARFTESFEPPDTELTGLVSGEVMIALNLEGLQDLQVNLEAPEGITLNRSAVELILLSQQVGDFTAGGTLSKVVQRVIGEAPHRPFESASLQLGFEDGRITGVALLKSAALNLTVDIKADPGALAEALRIRTN